MKKLTPTERIISLIFYLNYPFGRTIEACLDAFEISRTTYYDYKKTIENLGFCIENENGKYFLNTQDSDNKWFASLFHISEEEAYLFARAIDKLDVDNQSTKRLKNRMLKVFDNEVFTTAILKQSGETIKQKLFDAIKNEKQVLLKNYHSGNSKIISDRLVEPFELSDSFNLIWCYDTEKQCNRQFKVSRICDIEITPFQYEYSRFHKRMLTDIFRFTGDIDKLIEVELDILAFNLLIEEYPLAEKYIEKINDNSYILKCNVAKYEGPCRFVLGLWGSVNVIGDNDFKKFVKSKIKLFK